MTVFYRNAESIVRERVDAVRAERSEELAQLAPLRAIYMRRGGAIASGAAGALSGLALFALTCASLIGDHDDEAGRPLTTALLTGWALMVVAYPLGYVLGGDAFRRVFARVLEGTGDLTRDYEALTREHVFKTAAWRLHRLEKWSLAAPLVAISLLAPLTLHFAFVAVFMPKSVETFDTWIKLSIVFVGHAHLAAALMAYLHARKLARTPTDMLPAVRHRGWLYAFGLAVLCGIVPGIVLIGIPPVLVAVTGIVFMPAAFLLAHKSLARQRNTIDAFTG